MAISDYEPIFQAAADEWGIHPALLKAVAMQESGGNPGAVSGKGARGMTGIMPDTAKGLGITDPTDPAQQIYAAAKYLHEGLTKEGNPAEALLYYHGGPNWRQSFGPESAGYVPAVEAHYKKLTATAAPAAEATESPDDFLARTSGAGTESPDDFLKRTGGTASEDPAAFLARTGGKAAAEPVAAVNVQQQQNDNATGAMTGSADLTPAQREDNANAAGAAMPGGFGAAPESRADVRAFLAETPGWTSSSILPIAVKNDANGQADMSLGVRPDLGPLRAIGTGLMDLFEGPETGVVTPEATNLLAGAAMGGRLAPSVARGTGAAIASDAVQAPLSAEFRANPLLPGATATPNPMLPTKAIQVGDKVVEIPAKGAAPAPAPVSANPTAITATAPAPAPVVAKAPVAVEAPKTAAEAKSIASAYYNKAEQDGGTLTPAFANKFIDAAKRLAPQSDAGMAVSGETPITALSARLEALRDKPISLQAAQEIDESLGGLIDQEFGVKGLSKDGKALLDLQSDFRDMIRKAGPDDVSGGTSGFDSLVQGRKAWSQAMKMDDLERIQQRAEGTDNPATGIKSGIRTLLNNRSRVRGYSDDEIAALKQAQQRGILGGALHVFGSRLIPQAAAVGGFFGSGPLAAVAAGTASHYAATAMRAGATKLQSNRLGNALTTLGKGVPPPPSGYVNPLTVNPD